MLSKIPEIEKQVRFNHERLVRFSHKRYYSRSASRRKRKN